MGCDCLSIERSGTAGTGLSSPWRDGVCSVAQYAHGTFRATSFSLVGWLPCRRNVAQGGRPTNLKAPRSFADGTAQKMVEFSGEREKLQLGSNFQATGSLRNWTRESDWRRVSDSAQLPRWWSSNTGGGAGTHKEDCLILVHDGHHTSAAGYTVPRSSSTHSVFWCSEVQRSKCMEVMLDLASSGRFGKLASRFVFELALPCKTSDLRPWFTGIAREPATAVPPQEQVRVPATLHNVRGRGSNAVPWRRL
jgi:hypothetical protein